MIETGPRPPLLDTKEASIYVGCFYYLLLFQCNLRFFQEKKFLWEISLPAGYTEELASIMSGGQKVLGSFKTPLLSKKITWYQRDDCCLAVTLVAKKKMKVSDIYWGSSVWNFNLGLVWFRVYMHFGLWIPTTYFKLLKLLTMKFLEKWGILSVWVLVFWRKGCSKIVKLPEVFEGLAKIGTSLWWVVNISWSWCTKGFVTSLF